MFPPPPEWFSLRKNFARAFAGWRKQMGLPLKTVAAELGCSLAAVQKWEKGTRFPGDAVLGKIIRYTGLNPCLLTCEHAGHCALTGCIYLPRPA